MLVRQGRLDKRVEWRVGTHALHTSACTHARTSMLAFISQSRSQKRFTIFFT